MLSVIMSISICSSFVQAKEPIRTEDSDGQKVLVEGEETESDDEEMSEDEESEEKSSDNKDDMDEKDDILSGEVTEEEQEEMILGNSPAHIENVTWDSAGFVTWDAWGDQYRNEWFDVVYNGKNIYHLCRSFSHSSYNNKQKENVQAVFNESGLYTIQFWQYPTEGNYDYKSKEYLLAELQIDYVRPSNVMEKPKNLHWEYEKGKYYACFDDVENASGFAVYEYFNGVKKGGSTSYTPVTRVDLYVNDITDRLFTAQTISPDISKWANSEVAYFDVDEIFTDTPKGTWYESAVQYVAYHGIMKGTGDGTTFSPNSKITRAQMATILLGIEYNFTNVIGYTNNNPFTDVKEGKWYTSPVLWAYQNGIVKGKKLPDGTMEFGVNNNITRQDLAVMLYSYSQYRGFDLTKDDSAILGYKDSVKSNYAKNAMAWAITQGIISGKGKSGAAKSELKLDPTGNATRAECAIMAMKLVEKNK